MNNNRSVWVKINSPLLIVLAFFLSTTLAFAEIEISDRPLDVEFQAASTTVMFLLDDSGSMDFELMTTHSTGKYNGKYYIFNFAHDYTTSSSDLADSSVWKTQWPGYNKIY